MTQRIAVGLTVVNLVLMVFALSRLSTVSAQTTPQAVRARSLEIVDEQGKLHAFLGVLPADPGSRMPNGKTAPETVILRLMDPQSGRPSVKLATSEQGSGLMLLGESRTQATWVILEADGQTSKERLKNENGAEQQLKP